MNFIVRAFRGNVFTVGYVRPDGSWSPKADFSNPHDAMKRCRQLNLKAVQAGKITIPRMHYIEDGKIETIECDLNCFGLYCEGDVR